MVVFYLFKDGENRAKGIIHKMWKTPPEQGFMGFLGIQINNNNSYIVRLRLNRFSGLTIERCTTGGAGILPDLVAAVGSGTKPDKKEPPDR